MAERDRIRWHCRRGLLELDIVLGRFLERELDGLSAAELDAFKALLELSDNDLWDLVAGRGAVTDGVEADLIRRLQSL
jgi:antitoxin CptB